MTQPIFIISPDVFISSSPHISPYRILSRLIPHPQPPTLLEGSGDVFLTSIFVPPHSLFPLNILNFLKGAHNLHDLMVHSITLHQSGPSWFLYLLQTQLEACPFISNTTSRTGSHNDIFKMQNAFSCNSSSINYLMKCNLCSKLRVEQMDNWIVDRFIVQLREVWLESNASFACHFYTLGRCICDLSVFGLTFHS